MFLHISRPHTNVRDIRSLSIVYSNMLFHLIPGSKCSTTKHASIRSNISKDSVMFPNQISYLNIVGTKDTLERSFMYGYN
jgi:hypothetical protein